MPKELKQLEKELRSLEKRFFKAVKDKSPDLDSLLKICQDKRKELITEEIEKSNYNIAEDLKLIAEDFKEKYPSIASDALKLVDAYSAKAKGEK